MIAILSLMSARRSVRSLLLLAFLSFATLTSRAVLVAWDPNPPSEGVEGYKLHLTTNGVTTTYNVGNVTLAALPTLKSGVTYTITVTAYNSAGESDPSLPLNYLVPTGVAPEFLINLSTSATAVVGGPLNLTVDVAGTPTLRYDWFKNNAPYANPNSPTLAIASALLSDSGDYYVRISNPIGAITSAVTHVTIDAAPVPPTISGHPQSLTLSEGAEATFVVQASGTPPLTYQWSKDGNPISANGPSYTITGIAPGDQGSYTVRVSNGQGFAVGGPAVLTVVPIVLALPPTITTQPTNQAVFEGGLIQLSVQVSGTAPFGYQWYRGPDAIPGAADPDYTFIGGLLDTGDYYAIVTNAVGAATSLVAQVSVIEFHDPPVILTQPTFQTVLLGSSADFTVEAFSDGLVTYQWFKNGNPISNATNQTLTLSGITQADGGQYSVRVTNAGGTAESEAAGLSVSTAPIVDSEDVSVTVAEGSSTTLRTSARGVGDLSYQWYRNDIVIPGATGANLPLNNVTPNDAGTYVALISDRLGTFISAPAIVTVIAKPSIVSQPRDAEAPLGGSAQFEVAAGPSDVSYQWLKDGLAIPGETDSRLTVASILEESAGTYSVRVLNSAGAVSSSSARLTIARPPQITGAPSSEPALQGVPFTLTVQATGSGTLTYQWFRNSSAIEGATSRSLSFPAPAKADEALYAAVVRNAYGSATSVVALSVILRPTFTEEPADLKSAVGASATLEARAEGQGSILYQWYKNGEPLPLQQASKLIFTSLTLADTGKYQVAAANQAGSVFSRTANVIVLNPPSITAQPSGKSISEGSSTTLSVVAAGSGPLNYQWLKGTAEIPGANAASLVVQDNTGNAAGTYLVRVWNEVGSVLSDPAQLVVTLAPRIVGQPQSTTVNEGSRSSFTLRGDASGSDLEYQWLKNETPLPGATSPNLTFSTVQRTDAGTYRVRVSNSAGSVVSEPAVLTVIIPPLIVRQPAGGSVLEDAPFTFQVEVTGDLPLDYQWFRNNVAISGATSASYTLDHVAPQNGGVYTVRVVNSAGSIASSAAELVVLSPPKIVSLTGNQFLTTGDSLLLSVRATGTEPLKYEWLKDGERVSGAFTPNLVFLGADPFDNGSYTVRVTNPFGTNLSAGIKVVVTDPNGGAIPSAGSNQAKTAAVKLSLLSALRGTAAGNSRYLLQFSPTLGGGWRTIGTATANDRGLLDFSLSGQIDTQAGFFRLEKE